MLLDPSKYSYLTFAWGCFGAVKFFVCMADQRIIQISKYFSDGIVFNR